MTEASGQRNHETDLTSTVYVVDDDAAMRNALDSLLRSVGLRVELFNSVAGFLPRKRPATASCLVLDVRLPGTNGLDFQAQLARSDIRIPVVLMTGHGDIPMSVRAMKSGALDFLIKPFREQDMLDAVFSGLEIDRRRREAECAMLALKDSYQRLTSRQKDVMRFVCKGLMNKQIASELGLSEITVKIHRSHVMRKMSVRTLADLVRLAEQLELGHPDHITSSTNQMFQP